MHILEKIVAYKKEEVKKRKLSTSIEQLEKRQLFNRICNSYTSQIISSDASGVIAEFKRKSPSKSAINLTANLSDVTMGYRNGGASAISVLTDEYFFGGSDGFLLKVREILPEMALLRKEFIIDEYQIIESKALGADIILLISEILTKDEVASFAKLARSLGMEVLLEMHTADQVSKYTEDVSMVGVNNRDLKTFTVDYERSKKLFDQLPTEIPKIAESGLSEVDTCVMLYNYGFRGFLIGEQFMKQENPGDTCRSFIREFMTKRIQP